MKTMRELWYSHTRNALKQMGKLNADDESVIGQRPALHARIADVAVNGEVSINMDQMDCDCSRWTSGYVVPATPRLVERRIEQVYLDAEGPVFSLWIDAPEKKADYYSRDLALEAYENGHAHVVYV